MSEARRNPATLSSIGDAEVVSIDEVSRETSVINPVPEPAVFEVGQKVVCVDDLFPVRAIYSFPTLPRRDGVYTVSAVVICTDWRTGKPGPSVQLAEITHFAASNGRTAGLSPCRFRLLNPEKMQKPIHPNGHAELDPSSALTPAEITVILDRSGSMAGIAGDAIGGFNAFVDAQRREPGEARLTLVLFDDQYDVPIKSTLLEGVPPLTDLTFVPRGSTALLDAIGRTLKEMTQSFDRRPRGKKPASVIVAILTDGMENASRHYTHSHIADLIAEKRAQGWQFIFLAANQDAVASAARINIPAADAVSYVSDGVGTAEGFRKMSVRTSLSRRRPKRPSGV